MKKISLLLLTIFLSVLLLLTNCSKKLYDHVNPLDPNYTGDDGGDDDSDGPPPETVKSIKFNTVATIIKGTNTSVEILVNDTTVTSPTVTVQITSLQDTVGISLQLNKTAAYTYKANLLFSRTTSAGTRIKVHDMDLAKVTYGTLTDTIAWESPATKYWYRTKFHATDFLYDQDNPPTDQGGLLGYWGGVDTGNSGDDYTDTVPISSADPSWRIVLTAAGGGYLLYGDHDYNPTFEDLSAYAAGHVCFYIKSTVNVKIALDDPDATQESGTTLTAQGVPLDGEWHFVSIPMSTFTAGGAAGCNLTQLKAVGFHYTGSATYRVDQIFFVQE